MINIIKNDDALMCEAETHTEHIEFKDTDLFSKVSSFEDLKNNQDSFYILKHSNICPISKKAYDRVVDALKNTYFKDILVYLIVVQDQRDISNQVAQHYNITHESPQLLKIKQGKVIEAQNHLDILK